MLERTLELPLEDHVNWVHLALWDNVVYRRLLDAVDDAGTLEGSLAADDFVAATMIRKHAVDTGNDSLKGVKLVTIVRALHAVLRHHGLNREDRANTVYGTVIPGEE